jgi:hypothetical protein
MQHTTRVARWPLAAGYISLIRVHGFGPDGTGTLLETALVHDGPRATEHCERYADDSQGMSFALRRMSELALQYGPVKLTPGKGLKAAGWTRGPIGRSDWF